MEQVEDELLEELGWRSTDVLEKVPRHAIAELREGRLNALFGARLVRREGRKLRGRWRSCRASFFGLSREVRATLARRSSSSSEITLFLAANAVPSGVSFQNPRRGLPESATRFSRS